MGSEEWTHDKVCVGGFWKRGEATGGLGKRVRAHHGRREAERTIFM